MIKRKKRAIEQRDAIYRGQKLNTSPVSPKKNHRKDNIGDSSQSEGWAGVEEHGAKVGGEGDCAKGLATLGIWLGYPEAVQTLSIHQPYPYQYKCHLRNPRVACGVPRDSTNKGRFCTYIIRLCHVTRILTLPATLLSIPYTCRHVW